MRQVNYFAVIHKYLTPDSFAYASYLPHVAAVTFKALRVARRLGLSVEQLRFIEEAAMLHDIGVVKVAAEWMGCTGKLPYLSHLVEGQRILEAEGLPRHARVAARHVGLGITKKEIVTLGLPLPPRDIFPETIEEQVISWADLFFSKVQGELWREKTPDEVRQHVAKYGERATRTFDEWLMRFGD